MSEAELENVAGGGKWGRWLANVIVTAAELIANRDFNGNRIIGQ